MGVFLSLFELDGPVVLKLYGRCFVSLQDGSKNPLHFFALLTMQSVNSGKESHLFSSASALGICTASLRGLSIKRLLSFNVSRCGSGILLAAF